MEPPEPLEEVVRRLFGSVGVEVSRSGGARWISDHRIHTVFDVGANAGKFARDIRRWLPDAWIYSFEPVPQAFGKLQGRFRHDAKFHAQQLALGDGPGSVNINVSDFSPSSSLLGMSELVISVILLAGTAAGLVALPMISRPRDADHGRVRRLSSDLRHPPLLHREGPH